MKRFSALVAILLPALAATAAPEKGQKSTPSTTQETPAPAAGVVDAAKLRELLPEPPKGWKAERPETQSSSDEEIHLSSARRSYYTGTGEKDPAASVTIIDSVNNADFFDADEEGAWEQESKTEDGYDKRLIRDGMKIIEHYSKENATGSLSIFVGQRYFVQIELTNDDPAKLYDWLKLIDLQKLAALR